MINKMLSDFIKTQKELGSTNDLIKTNLLNAGWLEKDIDEALSSEPNINSAVPTPPPGYPSNTGTSVNSSPKRIKFKRIIVSVLSVVVIAWLGIETINYLEYRSLRNSSFEYPKPPSDYTPLIVNVFRYFFPERSWGPHTDYKPVIYLYPPTTENVQVELNYNGTIIADYPTYDTKIKGWVVTAYPDGRIIDRDGSEYSYLFWEGVPSKKVNYDLTTGFVVRGSETKEFLQTALSKLGLTPKEYNEFIVYWYPKMKDNKFNFIHFAGKEYTDNAPLKITPSPDSVLRVFMVFKSLDKEISVKPQTLDSFTREGFTVIEWGGTEIK